MARKKITRRDFVSDAGKLALGAFVAPHLPTIVPRHVLGGPGYRGAERHGELRGGRVRRNGVGQCAGVVEDRAARGGLRRRSHLRRVQRRGQAAAESRGRRQSGGDQAQGAVRQSAEVHGLPRDAREAEGHRRHRGRHAGSQPRGRRQGRDGSRQARLRAEAAHVVGARSARASTDRDGESEARDADGQPGPLERRRAADQRMDSGGRDRPGAPGLRLDEPSARLLAAGHSAADARCARRRRGRRRSARRGIRVA